MKRTILFPWILLMAITLGLVGCGGSSGDNQGTSAESPQGTLSGGETESHGTSVITTEESTPSSHQSVYSSGSGQSTSSETSSPSEESSTTACDAVKILSDPIAIATVGKAYEYKPTASGALPYSWELLRFPTGMSLESNTGRINWTPTKEQLGSNRVTLKVANSCSFEEQDFQVKVSDQLQIVPPDGSYSKATEGLKYQVEFTATIENETTWQLKKAPAGMTLSVTDQNAAKIIWIPTPNQLGNHQVEIAAYSFYGNDTFAYDLTVDARPMVFVSQPSHEAFAGALYTYQPQLEGTSPFTFALLQKPQDMTIDSASGLVSWTPDVSLINSHYTVTIHAVGPTGLSADQTYDILVSSIAPTIIDKAAEPVVVGVDWSYQAEAAGTPKLVWSLGKGYPEGMSINADSGLISWKNPAEKYLGSQEITIKVKNASGATERALTLLVYGPAPRFVGDVPQKEDAYLNAPFEQTLEVVGAPEITLSLVQFPSGMQLVEVPPTALTAPIMRKIVWTPVSGQENREHPVKISASNSVSTTLLDFTVFVYPPAPPTITSSPVSRTEVGQPYLYQAVAEGASPLTWSLTKAPAEMTVDAASGKIGWLPKATGTFDVSVRVSNIFGQASQDYQLEVFAIEPQIVVIEQLTALLQVPLSYQLTANGSTPIIWKLEQGPQNMTIGENSGQIDWTASALGDYDVTVKAQNVAGTAFESFVVRVVDSKAQILSEITPADTEAYVGVKYRLDVAAAGQEPISWKMVNGPSTMTIRPVNNSSARINWDPTESDKNVGVFDVTIAAWNDFNSENPDTLSWQIHVYNREPVITPISDMSQPFNKKFEYQPEVVGAPAIKWAKVKGPDDLLIDANTGFISWMPPTEANQYEVEISATNTYGNDSAAFTITVGDFPVITSTPIEVAVVGGLYRYQLEVSGTGPFAYSFTQRPDHMQIDADGYVTWIPDQTQVGKFSVGLFVENSLGSATQNFYIDTILEAKPDPAKSNLYLSAECVTANGFATAEVILQPRDSRGAYLPPMFDVTIEKVGSGTFLNEVVSRDDGSYFRLFQAGEDAGDPPVKFTASIVVDGVPSEVGSKFLGYAEPASIKGGVGGCPGINGQMTFTIIDRQGNPLEEAFIMIGGAENKPFEGNIAWTDENGHAVISSPKLQGQSLVTVGLNGYQWLSVYHVNASDLILPLEESRAGWGNVVNVSGSVTNYTTPAFGNLALGFVLENFSVDEIFGFNFMNLLEPYYETEIYGTVIPLPGNVVIPPQQVLGSSLNENYRLLVDKNKTTDLIVNAGEISVVDLLDLYSSYTDMGTFVADVLTKVTPKKAGSKKDLLASKNLTGQNIPLSHTLEKNLTFQLGNVPQTDLDIIGFSLRYDDNLKKYQPTGFSVFESTSVKVTNVQPNGVFANLKLAGAVAISDLSGATGKNNVCLKRGLSDQGGTVRFDNFMPMMSSTTRDKNIMKFSFDPGSGVKPNFVMGFVKQFEAASDPNTGMTYNMFNTRWNILAPADMREFSIPTLPKTDLPGGPVPTGLIEKKSYKFFVRTVALTLADSFDFNAFSFDTWPKLATHAVSDSSLTFAW